MTLPDIAARIVVPFADEVRPLAGVRALYAGGSLGTGDFRVGVSDFDLVAVVDKPLSSSQEDDVQELHLRVMVAEPLATKLHCSTGAAP